MVVFVAVGSVLVVVFVAVGGVLVGSKNNVFPSLVCYVLSYSIVFGRVKTVMGSV